MDKVVNSKKDLLSPLINVDGANLEDLAPATVITAGIDPLRSDGEKLAEHLRDVGNIVEHSHYPGATHEFFGMATLVQAARDAQEVVTRAQRRYLGVSL